MLISKKQFAEIIDRLKNYDNLQKKINELFKDLLDNQEQDFANAGGICIRHESAVIKVLEVMFETDLISWWIYEKNYGKNFKIGDLEDNGKKIDLSTSEKLYEYLLEEINKGNKEVRIL